MNNGMEWAIEGWIRRSAIEPKNECARERAVKAIAEKIKHHNENNE